ncbi:MAG: hypothetical protein U9Q98_08260 [Bacteroidota bacterium]|nr:hypothetical protein [Bacteroidota bacterium]
MNQASKYKQISLSEKAKILFVSLYGQIRLHAIALHPCPDAAGRSSPAICHAVLLVLYPGRQEFTPITLLPAQNQKNSPAWQDIRLRPFA